MKRKTIHSSLGKKCLSAVLSMAVAASIVPAFSLPAGAADSTNTTKPQVTKACSVPADESTITEGQPFASNTAGSTYFRIPAIVSMDNGDLVAAADARWETSSDGGGLDTIASVSTDGGETWNYSFPFYFPDSNGYAGNAATTIIDPALIEGDDGTIYCFADVNPTGSTTLYKTIGTGTGYVTVNGNRYLALTMDYDQVETAPSDDDLTTYPYYVGDLNEEGYAEILKRADSSSTGYAVDEWYNIYTIAEDGTYLDDLTQTQVNSDTVIQQNAFYQGSTFHVYSIGYIWMITSKDHGKTWEHPQNINDQIKRQENENAILVSPGKGITTSDGTLVLGFYDHGDGEENASIAYSRDGGVTWSRTNDVPGADDGGYWSSENEIVELEDGTLRMFFRNGTNTLCYSDATLQEDGSYVMQTPVKTDITTWSGCNLTASSYSKKINGKQAIIVGCPTGPGARINGKFFTFTVGENNALELVNSYDIPKYDSTNTGELYNYSCLTEDPDGSLSLLWETSWANIVYTHYDLETVVPNAYIEGTTYDLKLWEGDTFSRSYQSYQNDYMNGIAIEDKSVASAEQTIEKVTYDVIPLYELTTSNSASTLASFSTTEASTLDVETAEMTFTAAEDGTENVYTIYNEANKVYLGNSNASSYFASTKANDMQVTLTEGSDTFKICRALSDGTYDRYIIFYFPNMNFNGNSGGISENANWDYELTLFEKKDEASSDDLFPGYQKVTSITSGKKYLITYHYTKDGADAYMLLYPTNGASNQTKLMGTAYKKTEERTVDITITGKGEGTTTINIDNVVYNVTCYGSKEAAQAKKTELETLTSDPVKDLDTYTEDTRKALEDAMANAEALLASETATASELQAAYDGIKTAKAGLVTQKKADALEELAPQITGAETLLGQKDTYTAESLAALEAAYKEAVAIQANSAASAEEVAAAMNKVKAAAANLKKQPVAVTEEQTKVGTTFTYKNATYKVTSANTVSFVKPLKKTNSKFTVPATASKDGVTYKVTAIEKNAFKGNKKLKAVTVGKNVTSIGANAFSGDGKLKKITVKSKVLKSVGKKALKGISSSATVKVPKAKKAAYQKLFKGKGQKASVKIK